MYDDVLVGDSGRIRIRAGGISRLERSWGEKSVVEVKGWVRLFARERGKLVKKLCRDGHNIWTNSGREYLAMLQSYKADGTTAYRSDRIGYIGVGSGYQTEDASVASLATPVEYRAGIFLAPISHTATEFPLSPTRTTVQYSMVFAESDLTFGGTTSIAIGELGLFTNGSQSTFAAGGRDTAFGTAGVTARAQSPAAYQALVEPIAKTNGLEIEVQWEIRF